MTDIEQKVYDYLIGKEVGVALVDEVYKRGGALIRPFVHQTPPALKSTGVWLSAVFTQSAKLEASVGLAEAGRRNFQAEMDAGRPVDQVFKRTQNMLRRITSVSAEQASAAGAALEAIFFRGDQIYCAIAAIQSGTANVPAHTVLGGLLHVYEQENIPLTLRAAVASGLLGFMNDINREYIDSALQDIKYYAREKVYLSLPAVVQRVKNEYLKGVAEWQQDILITKLGIYCYLVHALSNS